MRRSDDKLPVAIVAISAALLVSLVVAIASFTDIFAEAFPTSVIVNGLVWCAGLSVGFGVVHLLTISQTWGRSVAGAIVLSFGLLFAGLALLIWAFFNSPTLPEWLIQAAERLPSSPSPRTNYLIQSAYGLMSGVFLAGIGRFFQKPWQETSEIRKVPFSLVTIIAGVATVILVYIFSGN